MFLVVALLAAFGCVAATKPIPSTTTCGRQVALSSEACRGRNSFGGPQVVFPVQGEVGAPGREVSESDWPDEVRHGSVLASKGGYRRTGWNNSCGRPFLSERIGAGSQGQLTALTSALSRRCSRCLEESGSADIRWYCWTSRQQVHRADRPGDHAAGRQRHHPRPGHHLHHEERRRWQTPSCQHSPVLVDDLDVVMGLSPVVPDEQHPLLLPVVHGEPARNLAAT